MIANADQLDRAARFIGYDQTTTDGQFQQNVHEYKSGYFAGGTSRFLPMPPGVNPLGTNADYHYGSQHAYFLMMERARFNDRDNMVIGQGVNRFVSNVMQTGFVYNPDTGDPELDKDIKQDFDGWGGDASEFDYEGERTFAKSSEMLLRASIVDGDAFAMPTNTGRVQFVEGHSCRNPYGVHNRGGRQAKTGSLLGVQMNNGRRTAFHFTADAIQPVVATKYRSRRYWARDQFGNRQVFHIYNPKRFTQTRGVTAFAPIVFPMQYHDDLQFANLVNAKRQGFIAIFSELDVNTPNTGTRNQQSGSRSTDPRDDGTNKITEGGSPGQMYKGVKGEKLHAFSPNIPGPQFFQHAELLLTIMAVNLDLPLMVFMLDASKTNFNGYRGAIDQARMRMCQFQRDHIDQYHTPTANWRTRYRMQTSQPLRNAAKRLGKNLFRHKHTPQGWPYIQPVQDAAADAMRLEKNLISDTLRARERGMDWEELSPQIINDRKNHISKAIEAADELNEQFDEANVQWREIAFGQGSGVKVSLTGTVDGEEAPAEQPKDESNNPNTGR